MFETFTRPTACGACAYRCLLIKNPDCRPSCADWVAEVVAEGRCRRWKRFFPGLGRGGGRRSHAGRRHEAPRVGLLRAACSANFFRKSMPATARVLAAEGCEVVAPEAQPCCGALLVHAGEEAAAVELAKRTIDAFERANRRDGRHQCRRGGSNVKEYGHLLRDDPDYAERARVFAAKCKDISEVLAGSSRAPHAIGSNCAWRSTIRVTCSMRRRSFTTARITSSIPGLELAEIPEAAICCGSAGIFTSCSPDAANELGDSQGRTNFLR